MSLAERWNEYRAELIFINQNDEYAAQRAFYAGADAVLQESATPYRLEQHVKMSNMEDEIDHFRSHKAR